MAEAPFPVRVVKVTDGDTVHARPLSDPSVLYKVRLQGIDAPETKQDYGAESTAALNALLFPNKQVYLKTNGTDKYHRTLGTLYVKSDGKLQDVHLEMVRQGHAWTYRAYTFPPEYDVAEREARAAKRGLWASPAPQPPWEWRQEHKHHPWQRRAHRARKHYHRYVSACLEEPQEEALERTSDDPKAAYYISHLFQPKRWNRVFRQVEHTARFSQVVKMTLQSNELVPAEVHPDNDQVLICKSGEGVVTLGAADAQVNVSFKPGRLVVINAGTRHAIQALEQGVQLWSLYAPWHHPVGTVQRTNPELVAPLVPAPLIGEKCTEEQCFSHLRDPTPLGQVLGGRILFGSLKHASNSDTLREHKITHIVSTIGPPECRIKGYVYYWVKLHDDEHQHLVNQVVLAEQWMRAELDKQPSARILVHCKAGVSRSASLVIAYLIMEHGYTYDAALAEVRERREIANPNPSFEEQLRSMEHVQRRTLAVHTKLLRPVQRAYEPYTSDVTF